MSTSALSCKPMKDQEPHRPDEQHRPASGDFGGCGRFLLIMSLGPLTVGIVTAASIYNGLGIPTEAQLALSCCAAPVAGAAITQAVYRHVTDRLNRHS